MKRIIAIIAFLVLTAPVLYGQGESAGPLFEPTQRPDATFRMFHTINMFTLLKLDTRSGKIWQVQYATNDNKGVVVVINDVALVEGGKPGRFTLYHTKNIHTFILLDQETGRTWQVQYGDDESRFIQGLE